MKFPIFIAALNALNLHNAKAGDYVVKGWEPWVSRKVSDYLDVNRVARSDGVQRRMEPRLKRKSAKLFVSIS